MYAYLICKFCNNEFIGRATFNANGDVYTTQTCGSKQCKSKLFIGKNNYFYGKHHTKKSRYLMGHSEYHKHLKGRNGFDGKGSKHKQSSKDKVSLANSGRKQPDIVKEKHRKVALQLWKNPEYASKVLSKTKDGNSQKYNKQEKKLDIILQKYFPGKFIFSGAGRISLDGKIPDFIKIDTLDKVIELNGIYWHLLRYLKKNKNITKEEVERQEKIPYTQRNVDVLFVWDDELNNENNVKNKIENYLTL